MYKHIGISFLLCFVPLAWGMENLDAEVHDSMRSALSRGLDRFGGAGVIRKFGRKTATPLKGEETVPMLTNVEETMSKPLLLEKSVLKPVNAEENVSKLPLVNEGTHDVVTTPTIPIVKSVEVTEVQTKVPTLSEKLDTDEASHGLVNDSVNQKENLSELSEAVNNEPENHNRNVAMKEDNTEVEKPANVETKKLEDTESEHKIPSPLNEEEYLVGNLFDDDQ